MRGLLDAVADVLRGGAAPQRRLRTGRRSPRRSAAVWTRPGARTPTGARPQLVALSLRVEADEDELVAGSVRLVLQVHDEQDPLHLVDAALLWTGVGGRPRLRRPRPRARHDRAAGRGRGLAGARPAARARRSRPDHPRHRRAGEPARRRCRGAAAPGHRRALAAQPRPRPDDHDRPRPHGPASPARGSWSRACSAPTRCSPSTGRSRSTASPLTVAEMERLRAATGPLLRLRGQWTVVDPAVARRRQASPGPHGQAGRGGRCGADRHRGGRRRRARASWWGRRLLTVRDQLRTAATRDTRRAAGGPGRDPARLPAARPHLARPAHRSRARRLPGRRHGPGQDRHADRPPSPPPRDRAHRPDAGRLPGVAARHLGDRGTPLRPRRRRPAVPRVRARSGRWRGTGRTTGSC